MKFEVLTRKWCRLLPIICCVFWFSACGEQTKKPMPLSLESLSKPLSDELVFSKNIRLVAPYRVMQGFDLDSKGNLYYAQLGTLNAANGEASRPHELYIIKSKPNDADVSDRMTLQYFGHGSNVCIEETEDGEIYVWAGSNSSKNIREEKREYWDAISVSRIKYESGKVVSEGYGGQTFFLNSGGKKELQPAVNVKDRRLAIASREGDVRYFHVYNLDEAFALPDEEFVFEVSFGGEEENVPEQTVTKTVKGKDLSKLTPLANFHFPIGTNKATDFSSYSMQGIDIVNDYIYFNEGNGNKNKVSSGHSNDYVTVYDFGGNVVRPRTAVAAITDLKALNDFGFTDSGYMEGEGIKVKGDKIYLGFASRRDPNAEGGDNFRRANIFVYDCKK